MNKKVAVMIVNWDGLRLLQDCLSSLFTQTYDNFEVFFVDNGSIDKSIEFVENNFSKVNIIKLSTNLGFSGGNNEGFKKILENEDIEYVVLLNNDTKVEKEFLSNLVSIAEKDTNVGAVAPKMKNFYETNVIDSIGILINEDGSAIDRGAKEKDVGQYDLAEEIFGACGGAVLYKRKMLEEIKYNNEIFDNAFFAYYEDLDLAWRGRLLGWKALSCPKSIVYHIHSATAKSHSPFKSFHVHRNRYFVMIKNFPLPILFKALLLTPLRYFRLLKSVFIKKGVGHKLQKSSSFLTPFKVFAKAIFSLLRQLPAVIKKRKYIQKTKKVSNVEVRKWFKEFGISSKETIF